MESNPQRNENMGSGENFYKQSMQNTNIEVKTEIDLRDQIRKVLISIPFQIIITILTIYSLFGDDIRTAFFKKSVDLAFDGINIGLMVVFGLQLIVSSIVVQNYFLSFYFFLDLISSISLLFDISIFNDIIYLSSYTNNYTYSKMATQSKASRAAIRAIRVVKLFRIIRIVKLYKSAIKAEQINQKKLKQQELKQRHKLKFDTYRHQNNQQLTIGKVLEKNSSQNGGGSNICKRTNLTNTRKIYPEQMLESCEQQNQTPKLNLPLSEQDGIKQHSDDTLAIQGEISQMMFDTKILDEMDKNESKIRKILGDATMTKIIIFVLLLMFIVPLFDSQIYIQQANSFDLTLNHLNDLLLLPSSQVPILQISSWIDKILQDHKDDQFYLLYFSTPFNQLPYYKLDAFSDQRIGDIISSSLTINVTAIMTVRRDVTVRGNLTTTTGNPEETTLLCMLDQSVFNSQTSYLSMGRTLFICVLLIALLYFFNKDIEILIVKPIEKMMDKLKAMAENPQSASKEEIQHNAEFQTTVVSNAIVKIGALLSIVFGSAGAQIIGKNIVQEGDMNPMLEGKKKCAIFGFCDIRKFTQINDILQEDILRFVNKISSIVHKAVYRYGGSANKNIGQAFLLVWKIPQTDYLIHNETNEITWNNKQSLSILVDFSVYSFIKILIKINKSPEILEYRKDYRLLEKIPNYKVEMGFGLHIGWAIEGAIGSDYKIDASYLSPNVNMASRLQAATKQFGVNLLLSQSLYDLMTTGLQKYCRNIDRVTVKGSNKPLKLYTVDMNLDNISPPTDKILKYPNIPDYQPDVELKRDINLQFFQPEEIGNYQADNFVMSKKQLREVLVDAVPPQFKIRFQEGVKCYLAGKWADAKLHFSYAQKIRSHDGPTKRLLNYMKNFDFIAPPTWKDYRQLTSK